MFAQPFAWSRFGSRAPDIPAPGVGAGVVAMEGLLAACAGSKQLLAKIKDKSLSSMVADNQA